MRNESEYILYEQIRGIADAQIPFHMPGHKRRVNPVCPEGGIPEIDITEVTGADNLHHPEGILREAMQRTAELFHADRTYYLVNGSTVGNLAGIGAALSHGGEAICAAGCHRSVRHALQLRGAKVHWIEPERVPGWGIRGSVTPERIRQEVAAYPEAELVIVTSPTYEGVISDIKGIAQICHEAGKLLFVDEAHGAHLGLFKGSAKDSGQSSEFQRWFPDGAIAGGADLIVQSAHKTLPSLTQTAFLHVMGDRVSPARVEEQLDIFETSSPSYLLMCSLDGCTGILRNRGEALFRDWAVRLVGLRSTISQLQNIEEFMTCMGPGTTHDGNTGQHRKSGTESASNFRAGDIVYDYDPGKLLLRAKGITGDAFLGILSEEYHIEAEMAFPDAVLLMTSCCDTKEMTDALSEALKDLDRRLLSGELPSAWADPDSGNCDENPDKENLVDAPHPGRVLYDRYFM